MRAAILTSANVRPSSPLLSRFASRRPTALASTSTSPASIPAKASRVSASTTTMWLGLRRHRLGRWRRQGVLQLLGVLLRQRGLDDRAAVLLERGDRLVRRALLDDHEQAGGPRLEVVLDLLLEGLVDALLAEVAHQCAHAGAQGPAGERDEEQQAEEQSPEAAPDRAARRRRAAVRRADVISALEVAGDRGNLVGLDDQVRFELLNGPARLFRRPLVRVGNGDECGHVMLLLSKWKSSVEQVRSSSITRLG